MAVSKEVSKYVTVAEVADILGVKKPNVYKVRGLPRPERTARVWRRDEVEEFAKEYRARRAKEETA